MAAQPFMTAPRLNPQQLSMLSEVMKNLQPQMQGFQNLSFEPIREKSLRDYQRLTAPSIGERMQAMGGAGTFRSSGRLEAEQAGRQNLLESLASQEQQFNLTRQGLLNQLLSIAMSDTQDNYFAPQQSGFGDFLLQRLPSIAGGAIMGGITGNVPGAIAGGLAGLGGQDSFSNLMDILSRFLGPQADNTSGQPSLGAQ